MRAATQSTSPFAQRNRTEDGRPYDDRHHLLTVTDDDAQLRDGSLQDGPGIRDLLSLGGMLVGCIVVCVAIGLFADAQLGSTPIGVLAGTAIGIVLAGIGFWLRVRVYLQGR